MDAMSPPRKATKVDFEKLIFAYVTIRDYIQKKNEEHEAALAGRKTQLEMLNQQLLKALNETGQDSAKTKAGTAYRKSFVSVTVADKDAFRRHVIGTEDWDLVDWRANKTAITKIVEEEQEPPPGVNFSKSYDVGVRRPGKDS